MGTCLLSVLKEWQLLIHLRSSPKEDYLGYQSIQAIGLARQQFQYSDLREKLVRYHDDPASTFQGWNDIWLHPDFLKWDIRELLPNIRCPILAIQGEDDPYGTMAQVDQIKNLAKSKVEVLKLGNCRHSPHSEKPEETINALKAFIGKL